MEKKTQKTFIDHGFGFPIVLENVPMVKTRGVWTPHVDYNELGRVVLHALAFKPGRLTGHEIRFVRQQLEMTLQAFAKRFCVTHVAVMKWERAKAKSTVMSWTTEKDIRLFILSKLEKDHKEIASLYLGLE